MKSLIRLLALSLSLLAIPPGALADSGVDDSRVSLPDGPGSIGGVGENAEIDPNMGMARHRVPIDVPKGYPSATPSVTLSYSSTAGSGVVGMGWSMGEMTIERMTLYGLPEYTTDDTFMGPTGELVHVGMLDGSRVYRSRDEGSFVRYRWYDVGGGGEGYWTAEQPDGSVEYYGADEAGSLVASSRVSAPDGTYRYHLVAKVDVWGHVVRYAYTMDGAWPLLDTIAYVYDGGMTPRFAVRFGYEDRDDIISTGEPGFVLELTQRLAEVRVLGGSETIRRYELGYEDLATSGGISRLAQVQSYGRGDERFDATFDFGYSASLEGACSDCETAYVVDMGTLPDGITISSGRSTLLDVTGDALPDILSTSATGEHTWVITEMDPATGIPSFASPQASTSTTGGSSFILSAPGVQALDVNGDGFTDLISSRSGGQVLCNDGSGDWNGTACLMDSTLPQFDADTAGDANPRNVRFFDYDDDKRIDVLRTLAGSTEVFVNDGTGFAPLTIDDIGAQFDVSPTLQLSDLNGDGLQDPVEILGSGSLRYRINLGYGRWTDWTTISFGGFTTADVPLMQLEDMNGDGLADIVVVTGDQVKIGTNRNAGRFADARTVTSADVDGSIPSRIGDTVVLFADMNGNGSRDVVWFRGSKVDFLELYPVKPNLLARIENGMGSVQEITYGSSVLEQARDSVAWEHALPYGMNLVTEVDSWVTLTGGENGEGLHMLMEYQYRDGFYDGNEKKFRGYAHVERRLAADTSRDSQEPGLRILEYDLGDTDRYRAGRLLFQADFGGEDGTTPLRELHETWEDCPVAEVSGATPPVRHVCRTASELVLQEGAAEAEWAVTRDETTYDGYGNALTESRFGVTHMGSPDSPQACASTDSGPSGADCTGDELITETTYIDPGSATGGAWILGQPSRKIMHGGDGGPQSEERYYYDGAAFMGLPSGQLTRGFLTRREAAVAAGEYVELERYEHDAHGNVVEALSPNGTLSDTEDARKVWTYDAVGLNPLRSELLLRDADGNAYRLRSESSYDEALNQPLEVTDWQVIVDGSAVTPRNSSRVRYDAFGRATARLIPGDEAATPAEEYEYLPGDPVSRVLVHSRNVQNGTRDGLKVNCMDGQGRQYQSRIRLSDGTFLVDGYKEFNRHGKVVVQHFPYVSTSDACDLTAPETRVSRYQFDALGRQIRVQESDESIYGTASETRWVFTPLSQVVYDPEDNDPESPHFDTPVRRHRDGLGRVIRIERDAGDEVGTVTARYDGLGRLTEVTDPLGNTQVHTFDLLDRALEVVDPDEGSTTFTYAPDGAVLSRTDARGRTVDFTYDGLSRALTQGERGSDRVATWTYDYDPECSDCDNGGDRIVKLTYPLDGSDTGVQRFGYDARGNNTWREWTLEGHTFIKRTVYDPSNLPLRMTYPDGTVIEHEYDDARRLTGITGIADFAYDERSLLSTIFHGNGVRTEHEYDSSARLSGITHFGDADVELESYALERDRAGNITAMLDGVADPTRPSRNAVYSYDALYRATGVAYGDDLEVVTTAFDLGDRITSRISSIGASSRAHVGDYEYSTDHPNAVVRAGDRSYAYDAAGLMTERSGRSFDWDHLGRMVEATPPTGRAGRFFHGPGPERVMKHEDGGVVYYLDHDLEVRDGIVNVLPRHRRNRVARLQSDALQTEILSDVAPLGGVDGEINAGDAWVSFSQGEGDDSVRLLRGAARRLLLEDGDDVTYMHYDGIGNAELATDASGAITGRRLYYPGGQVRHESGFVGDHGFTGQELDSSSGLHAFRHRMLDTDVVRWASPDPAFRVHAIDHLQQLGESTTSYAYIGNGFINANDPHGLTSNPSFGRRVLRGLKQALVGGKAGTISKFKTAGTVTKLVTTGLALAAAVAAGSTGVGLIAVGLVAGLILLKTGLAVAGSYSEKTRDLSAKYSTMMDKPTFLFGVRRKTVLKGVKATLTVLAVAGAVAATIATAGIAGGAFIAGFAAVFGSQGFLIGKEIFGYATGTGSVLKSAGRILQDAPVPPSVRVMNAPNPSLRDSPRPGFDPPGRD